MRLDFDESWIDQFDLDGSSDSKGKPKLSFVVLGLNDPRFLIKTQKRILHWKEGD